MKIHFEIDPNFGLDVEKNRTKWVVKTLKKIPRGKKILDAGAGECPFKEYCRHLKYYSQDFAQYNGVGDGKGLQTGQWDNSKIDIVSDITKIPKPKSFFDVILCTEVLEHIPDPLGALKEFSRLLKVNGKLIITTPFFSLTHFSPYHYVTGFNRYFFSENLPKFSFKIEQLKSSGDYFRSLGLEIKRLPLIAERYAQVKEGRLFYLLQKLLLWHLESLSKKDGKSKELLSYGIFVLAKKIK